MSEYFGAILATLGLIGGIIAAHFMGIEKAITIARNYTDKRFDDLFSISERRFDKIDQKMDLLIKSNEDFRIRFIEFKGRDYDSSLSKGN